MSSARRELASVKATFNVGERGFALTSLILGGTEALRGASGLVNDYTDQGGGGDYFRAGSQLSRLIADVVARAG